MADVKNNLTWVYIGPFTPLEWFVLPKMRLCSLLPSSGQDRGSGPGVLRRQQRPGHIRSGRTEDKERNVPNRRPTLQGVSHQTNGYAAEYQPQLLTLYHPQPREEGKNRARQKQRHESIKKIRENISEGKSVLNEI